MIDLGTIPIRDRAPTYLFADHITQSAAEGEAGQIRIFVIRTETPRLIFEILRDEFGGLQGKVVAQTDPLTKGQAKIITAEVAQFAAQQIDERSGD